MDIIPNAEDNVLDFIEEGKKVAERHKALQTGGPPPGHNWLITLEEGTAFLSKPVKAQVRWLLSCYSVVKTKGIAVLLYSEDTQYFWVDSKEYSEDNKLVEILGKVMKDGEGSTIPE